VWNAGDLPCGRCGEGSRSTGFAAGQVLTIGRRAIVERRKSEDLIDFGRLFNAVMPGLSCCVMRALGSRLRRLFAPEEDEGAPARRSRRDWIVDSALFGFAILFGGAALHETTHDGFEAPRFIIDAIGGAALCIALWGRRRWPFGLALAATPILAISSSAGAAGAITLFTVAAHCRWQRALLVAGLQLAMHPIYRAVQPAGSDTGSYLEATLATAAIVSVGMLLRARRQTRRESRGRTRAEQQLRAEQIRYAERTRIAREMHDVLAHRISLLSLHAGGLEIRPDASPEEIARAAGVIRASAHQALEDLREAIGLLRDGTDAAAPPPPQPTLATLPGLLEESRAAGMRLNADVRVADLAAVPDSIGRHALRIVQEALTNARKHAASVPVDLRIDGAPGSGLTIELHNPVPVLPAGTTEMPGAGTGLVGLAERAALAGGHLEHGRDERGDFHLRAWLPWPR
jgi:signal transduction histidine kinase